MSVRSLCVLCVREEDGIALAVVGNSGIAVDSNWVALCVNGVPDECERSVCFLLLSVVKVSVFSLGRRPQKVVVVVG